MTDDKKKQPKVQPKHEPTVQPKEEKEEKEIDLFELDEKDKIEWASLDLKVKRMIVLQLVIIVAASLTGWFLPFFLNLNGTNDGVNTNTATRGEAMGRPLDFYGL